MAIDSHCHLNLFAQQEVDLIVEQSNAEGVEILLTVCTKLEEVQELASIVGRNKCVYMSVGVHPNEAKGDLEPQTLIDLVASDKVVALGETGLDCYRDETPIAFQRKDFEAHVESARVTGLPLIIHSRNADEHMIEFLKSEMRNGVFNAVLHSFASSIQLCELALDLGLYISFSGIVTFKNAKELKSIAKYVPSDRILVETDSPYLAPQVFRGQRNHPKNVVKVLEFLVEHRQEADLERKIADNFYSLFAACGIN